MGSSSRTSSGSAGSSGAGTPRPAEPAPGDPAAVARDRKARRGPKRVPSGANRPAACDDPAPAELVEGIEQLNRGLFYEQHETLELLWRATGGPARDLYHGILQVGVGLHHWRNGNFHGATVLLAEGIGRLEPFYPSCQGVDVATLLRDARRLREELATLGAERMREKELAGALIVRFDLPQRGALVREPDP